MKEYEIVKASKKDIKDLAALASLLWPNHFVTDLETEFEEIVDCDSVAVYLISIEKRPIGFAQCSLRNDYVEGTKSSPVGYLEGIFIKPANRKKGYAKRLLAGCEKWAKEKGCEEFASDCELTNEESLHFHLNMGFAEANRIICFTKKL